MLRFFKITPAKCVILPDYDGFIAQPQEAELYRRTLISVHRRVLMINQMVFCIEDFDYSGMHTLFGALAKDFAQGTVGTFLSCFLKVDAVALRIYSTTTTKQQTAV